MVSRWLLVDGIDLLEPGKLAHGHKAFGAQEPFFADHFPGFPVVPGVLLLEALAQLSGKLIGYTVRLVRGDWPFPILSMMNGVKFRRFVRPGERVELETRLVALRDEMSDVRVRARVGSRVVAQAEQIFVFNAVPLEDPQELVRLERVEFGYLRSLWPGCPEHAWLPARGGEEG
ncbi:MAG: 3-hydroxyacyl-ACP dehydratase FabZ family protein [Pseudomonadota bacterium]